MVVKNGDERHLGLVVFPLLLDRFVFDGSQFNSSSLLVRLLPLLPLQDVSDNLSRQFLSKKKLGHFKLVR